MNSFAEPEAGRVQCPEPRACRLVQVSVAEPGSFVPPGAARPGARRASAPSCGRGRLRGQRGPAREGLSARVLGEASSTRVPPMRAMSDGGRGVSAAGIQRLAPTQLACLTPRAGARDPAGSWGGDNLADHHRGLPLCTVWSCPTLSASSVISPLGSARWRTTSPSLS